MIIQYGIKQSVPAGKALDIGSPYLFDDLLGAIPTRNIIIEGATATKKVLMLVAPAYSDPTKLNTPPADIEFWILKEYTANTVESIASLNGLWVKFKTDNTDTSAATITISIG